MKRLVGYVSEELLSQRESDSPLPIFLRRRWFNLLDEYVFGSASNARELVLKRKYRDHNVLPVYQQRGTFGNKLSSLTNYYSPIFRLITSEELHYSDYENFVAGFRRYFQCFDLLDFVPLYEEDANHLYRAFGQLGFVGFRYAHSVNWYEDSINGFDDYWAARPPRLRSTIKRKAAKLEQIEDFSIIVDKPASKGCLWKFLGDFHRVYRASWKKPEPAPAFIDAAAEYAWESGELLVGVAYLGSLPLAAQLWFVTEQTAYIYKLCYRREYASYSVGSVLSKNMFEAAIERWGVTCIDYLTGNDAYKQDWMSKRRALVGLQLCNSSTLLGQGHKLRNQMTRVAKHIQAQRLVLGNGPRHR